MSEQFFSIENKKITYVYRPKKSDRTHLLIIFSGYGGTSDMTYDFRGSALDHYPGPILWIKDDTDGHCAYYLNSRANPDSERLICSLIYSKLDELGINKNQCTLLGASKGGSASLYYGAKYNFKNIISSCPQFKIGKHISTRENSFKYLFGEHLLDEEKRLDDLLPDEIKKDCYYDKNIYLISSPHDHQYEEQVKPFTHLFDKYTNFNFVLTRSELAYQHNVVTRYNLPLILSIVYAHAENAFPRFGAVNNGEFKTREHIENKRLQLQREQKELVCNIDKMTLDNGVLHISGVSLIRGYPCIYYKDVSSHSLILKSNQASVELPVGKLINREISTQYYLDEFCDYRACGFSSFKDGIDLSEIKNDVYKVFIKTKIGSVAIEKALTSKANIKRFALFEHDEILFISDYDGARLLKRPLINHDKNVFFNLDAIEVKENRLFITGDFLVKGVPSKDWGDTEYYLSLDSSVNQYSFRIGKTAATRTHLEWDLNEYSKSRFATIGFKGIELESLMDGEYSIKVCLSNGHSIFNEIAPYKLLIDNSIPTIQSIDFSN